MQAAHLLVDLLPFCEQRLVALGANRAESDRVGADSARPVVDGKRACESLDRRLGGRVRQRTRLRALTLMRGNVEDRARAAAGEEAANGGRTARHRECEIERDRLQQLIAGRL
jgi:hypothetical protein